METQLDVILMASGLALTIGFFLAIVVTALDDII